MAPIDKSPVDLAQRMRAKSASRLKTSHAWLRQSFTLPREEARALARDWFHRYPKAAYATEVETWRVLTDGRIEFVMRRLPSAD